MATTDTAYLYGASGHAKVVMDILALDKIDVPCLIDDDPRVDELAGKPVVHSAEGLDPVIVTIGDCRIRKMIVEKLGDRTYLSATHPAATVAGSVRIGCGTVVMASAVLNPFAVVGNHCIINTGAVVDHDVKVGDFVHVAPHCTLCGCGEVGEGTWIGAGSTVIQGVRIGKRCFIGAGAVVLKDVPDGTLCYGNPARIIRYIDPDK